MNAWAKKAAMGFFTLLCLGALGCSGESTPGDTGVGEDRNDNGDKIILCQTDEQCGSGMECRDGVCVSLSACNCNYDCSKASSEICNRATNKCEPGSPPLNCRDDCDCYSGESCIGNQCVATGGDQQTCTKDSDCPQGQVCKGNSCVSATCQTRDDCAPPACICVNNECTTPPPVCQGDHHCCSGYRCNFGTCVPVATGCQSDANCQDPDYPRCIDGQCMKECVNDIDCPLPGQVCVDNRCVTPGCTPTDCDQGQWCDPSDGKCKPGCDSNDDCKPPDTCNYVTHQCGQTDCCGGCPADKYCDTLTCQCVTKCFTDADCPAGFHCNGGKCWCTVGSCPAGTKCNTQTGDCVPETVECQTNADCPAGWVCDLTIGQCKPQQTDNEGALCFMDSQCDQTTNPALMCDNCWYCVIFDDTFVPTYTCRFSCSLILKQCPIAGRECKSRRPIYQGLCMPP